jgi:hypothetical protein
MHSVSSKHVATAKHLYLAMSFAGAIEEEGRLEASGATLMSATMSSGTTKTGPSHQDPPRANGFVHSLVALSFQNGAVVLCNFGS